MSFPWRTALFISIALNLIIVSVVVGAYASGARLQRERSDVPAAERLAGVRAFMQALPPEARRDMRRELAREVVAMRAEREEVRAARWALYEAARAEPYDAARVNAAFARVHAADQAATERLQTRIAEAFGEVSAADRAAALDALENARPARGEDQVETPLVDGQAQQLTPEAIEQRREQRRDRIRERLQERREQRQGQ